MINKIIIFYTLFMINIYYIYKIRYIYKILKLIYILFNILICYSNMYILWEKILIYIYYININIFFFN